MDVMHTPSLGELVLLVSAFGTFVGAAMTALGRSLDWMVRRGETKASLREAKLHRWHDELDKRERAFEERVEAYQQRIERELEDLRLRDERRAQQLMTVRMAFQLVADQLRIRDPGNAALQRAEMLMNAAFDLDPILPADVAMLVDRIEKADAGGPSGGKQNRPASAPTTDEPK